ncbi:MAG: hypothetical protein E5Y32_04390 [Mesorhizobium sp.]|nr:MAG: hypothetical protein E5Y32_04390 [Mesorhizobium sp.]
MAVPTAKRHFYFASNATFELGCNIEAQMATRGREYVSLLACSTGFPTVGRSRSPIEIREGSEDHGAHGIIVSLQSVNQSIMWQRCSRISLHGNFPRQEPSIEIRDLDTQILDFF